MLVVKNFKYSTFWIGVFKAMGSSIGKHNNKHSLFNILAKKKVKDPFGCELDYYGEVDKEGFACGNGVATRGKATYVGTWVKDKLEGISKWR